MREEKEFAPGSPGEGVMGLQPWFLQRQPVLSPRCCAEEHHVGSLWHLYVCPSLLAVCVHCDQQTSATLQFRMF